MMHRKTVLLIAFHFPPVKGSSGVQRTLRFAQHLGRHGWCPIVLTVQPGAYEAVTQGAGNELPADLEVHRAYGLNASTSLSFFGRYPRWLALPDRWATWRYWAVGKALRIIRASGVDAVWSTFPIATAHSIALEVARRSCLPWIAEFRDPMWQGDYPEDSTVNRAWLELEKNVFARADAVVVATPGAASLYAERFPDFERSRIALIENGYDEETFARANVMEPQRASNQPLTLVHSGVIYPSERDPSHLFQAIATLKGRGRISASAVSIVLRASGNEAEYGSTLARLAIDDIVRLEPAIDYLSALREMLTADGLLILQASNCNAQIPAKLYEYLRAGRPILALTDPAGDTAGTLRRAGVGRIARLDSAAEIETALLAFLEEIGSGSWSRAVPEVVAQYSRAAQARQLADRLDRVVASGARR